LDFRGVHWIEPSSV